MSERNVEFARVKKIPIMESFDSALADLKPDGVIIASPNGVHKDQALSCIEKGIPVFVEKPLADDLQSAAEICRAAEMKRVPVLVGHHRTYSSYLSVAKDFICSGRFGDLVAIRGSALFHKPKHYFDDGPWRTQIGGGPILINLIHEIGIFRYLCGEIESVSAISSNKRRGFAVEDTVVINFVFANGALGSFVLSDIASSNESWEMTSGENPSYPNSLGTNCYHFAGTNGSLDFPTLQARCYGEEVEPSWWSEFTAIDLSVERVDPLVRQLAHFEDILAREADPIVTAKDGFTNMCVLEAVRTSINTGKIVQISDTLDSVTL